MLIYSCRQNIRRDGTSASDRISCNVDQHIILENSYTIKTFCRIICDINNTVIIEVEIIYILTSNKCRSHINVYC